MSKFGPKDEALSYSNEPMRELMEKLRRAGEDVWRQERAEIEAQGYRQGPGGYWPKDENLPHVIAEARFRSQERYAPIRYVRAQVQAAFLRLDDEGRIVSEAEFAAQALRPPLEGR